MLLSVTSLLRAVGFFFSFFKVAKTKTEWVRGGGEYEVFVFNFRCTWWYCKEDKRKNSFGNWQIKQRRQKPIVAKNPICILRLRWYCSSIIPRNQIRSPQIGWSRKTSYGLSTQRVTRMIINRSIWRIKRPNLYNVVKLKMRYFTRNHPSFCESNANEWVNERQTGVKKQRGREGVAKEAIISDPGDCLSHTEDQV